jgi:hypothetical protein
MCGILGLLLYPIGLLFKDIDEETPMIFRFFSGSITHFRASRTVARHPLL